MHPHDPIAAALDHCLSAPTTVPPLDSVDQWWPGWAALAAQPSSPMALALLGGFAADRVGWAFAAGYQSALRTLVPSLPVQALAAFCVTEEGGNRPRDIRTLITPGAGGGFHGERVQALDDPRAPGHPAAGHRPARGRGHGRAAGPQGGSGAGRSAGRHGRADARDRVRARGAPCAHPVAGRGDRRRQPAARRRLRHLCQAVPHPGRHLCDRSRAGLPAARGTGARLAGRPARAPGGEPCRPWRWWRSRTAMRRPPMSPSPVRCIGLPRSTTRLARCGPQRPRTRHPAAGSGTPPCSPWPPALASSARRAPGSGFRPDLLFLQSARLVKTYTTG